MKLYMSVTPDKLELPLFVADNVSQLAQAYGVHKSFVHTVIYKGRVSQRLGVKFIRVEAPDEEDTE